AVGHHPGDGRDRRYWLDLGRRHRSHHPDTDAGGVPLHQRLQAAGLWSASAVGDAVCPEGPCWHRQQRRHKVPQMTFLRVENVSMVFGGVRALDAVTMTLEKGELLGLIGPNGAGKTT